jgi:hypothetical protein
MGAKTIAFALYDESGLPEDASVPEFDVYKDAEGEDLTPPMIVNLGGGLYLFEIPEAEVSDGVAFLISTGALPSYFHGSEGPVVAFALYDVEGAPQAGQSPAFETYVDLDGEALDEPTIEDFTGGLYAFVPDEGTRFLFEIDSGSGNFPARVSGDGPSDFAAPHISSFTPSTGTAVGANTPISFTVSDPGLPKVSVIVKLSGKDAWEVVHDGERFAPLYSQDSSRSSTEGGYVFSVRRRGGWSGSPSFEVWKRV